SGDLPILLVRIAGASEMDLARQAITAHSYLRHKGLQADLVLLNEQPEGASDDLDRAIQEAARTSEAHDLVDKPGGLFVRRAGAMPEAALILLQAAARVVLVGDRGPLASQLERIERLPVSPRMLAPAPGAGRVEDEDDVEAAGADLLFDNGLGGFTPD